MRMCKLWDRERGLMKVDVIESKNLYFKFLVYFVYFYFILLTFLLLCFHLLWFDVLWVLWSVWETIWVCVSKFKCRSGQFSAEIALLFITVTPYLNSIVPSSWNSYALKLLFISINIYRLSVIWLGPLRNWAHCSSYRLFEHIATALSHQIQNWSRHLSFNNVLKVHNLLCVAKAENC